MSYFNNAIQTRRELIYRIIKLLYEGNLVDEIDRIPYEMRPRTKNPIRCCVHKDRAVLKYKLMASLGYSIADEEDELTPLSEYASHSPEPMKSGDNFLTVVDVACSSCVQVNYTVSNLCQGCEGRSCQYNCPKDAIMVINGKAWIDHQKCINCGLCQKACPYHAIAYLPVPCEEACAVKAIKKNEEGLEIIDRDKCTNCGSCMTACPFGAIMERSQIVSIFRALRAKQPLVAMVAPSVFGQYKCSPGQILGAIKAVGFTDVVEVALGAQTTVINESNEWQERMEEGDSFMTTSCCPSYVQLVKKQMPDLEPHMSTTKSPMIYTAETVKEMMPEAKLVFIGPCLAKRSEALDSEIIDFSMTFEEMDAFFTACDIDVENTPGTEVAPLIDDARDFAFSGGVTKAIRNTVPTCDEFKEFLVNGLDKKSINALRAFTKRTPNYNFVEVMACEGGCLNGPGSLTPYKSSYVNFKKNLKEATKK